jgi:hypothetical protein
MEEMISKLDSAVAAIITTQSLGNLVTTILHWNNETFRDESLKINNLLT